MCAGSRRTPHTGSWRTLQSHLERARGIHGHAQLRRTAGRNGAVFTVTGHNVRVFLNDRESVGGYLRPALGNNLSLAYDFQWHEQRVTQVKLDLQNKQN